MPDMFDEISKALKKKFEDKDITFGTLADGSFLPEPKEWISTGVVLLDAALRNGLPIGRIVELFGSESTGKSLLAIQILAYAQAQGCIIVLNDTESASSIDFITRMARVKELKNFYWLDADTLEGMFDGVNGFIDTVRGIEENKYVEAMSLWEEENKGKRKDKRTQEPVRVMTPIVILNDSIAMLPTKNEQIRLIDEAGIPGEAAKKIRQAMRVLTRKICHLRVMFVFTNHETCRIGAKPWQEKFTTYGGTGGRFGASVRIRMEAVGKIMEDGRFVGMKARATVYKSRFDAPGQQIEFPVYFKDGVHDLEAVVTYLYKNHYFGSKTGWFVFEGKSMRQADFMEIAKKDEKLQERLKEDALKLYHTKGIIEEDPTVVEGVD